MLGGWALVTAGSAGRPAAAPNTVGKMPRCRVPDLLRLAVKYVTNPRASGGMPPDGFPLSKSAQNFQAPRARNDHGEDDHGNIGGFLRVASKGTGVSGLADRYATALFDLADERKSLDQVADDLRQLRAMLAESAELRRLIRSPSLP